ncbi:MAG TPA: hypothetical protein VIR55_10930 [Ignavibacteria bacterium]
MISLELKNKVIEIIESIGYHFVDLKVSRSKNETIFEVLVDSDSGITITECQKISKELSKFFDSSEYNNYRLNVSSPGIGYPILYDWQFRKSISRVVEVKHKSNDKLLKSKGKLVDFNSDSIIIEIDKGEQITIKRGDIQIVREII